jgi:hypothetical protein
MKPRDYCCCAIPVVNYGIYLTLTEQFVLGIVAGTLSVATPDSNAALSLSFIIAEIPCTVVGAATPSFARWIFAIICYVGAMIQILGFIGVAKVRILLCLLSTSLVVHFQRIQENNTLFKRYSTLHGLITVAAFSIAAVWIGISASRHNTAKTNCENKFFTASSDLTTEGEAMCNIFPWVDIGLMGALWVLLAISQVYASLSSSLVPS